MIKHLIFDFDGVIIDSEILAAKAFADTLISMKINSKYSKEIIAEKFAGNKMIKVAEEICLHHGIKDNRSFLNRVMKLVSDTFEKQLEPVIGISDFLKKNNLDRYICSNSGKKRIIQGLKKIELDSFFKNNKIYTFEMVDNPKPSPDVYTKVIEDNKLIKEEVLVLEDSIPGVTAAVLAGLNVVGVTAASHWKNRSPEELKNVGTKYIINSYQDLYNLL